MRKKFMPDEIVIKDGIITLELTVSESAILAKACSVANKVTQLPANESDRIMFFSFAAMFKAAAIAALNQTPGDDYGYIDRLLEIEAAEGFGF